VYCGGAPETRDHVPSRVLLDDPYPKNLPVVDCCSQCNTSFSLNEEYVACFLECVLAGSVSPETIRRPKIARILSENTRLALRIANALQQAPTGEKLWEPEHERVNDVIKKLARGHIAYELSLPKLEEPITVNYEPLGLMRDDQKDQFLKAQHTPFLPEIGSRAFIRATTSGSPRYDSWQIVQPSRYQYLVSQSNGDFVRILLSDYLACEVVWD
jgi:hypothetical protein